MLTILGSIQFQDSREGHVTFLGKQGTPPPRRLSSPSLPVRRERIDHRVQWFSQCENRASPGLDKVTLSDSAARDAVSLCRQNPPRRRNKSPESARQSRSVEVHVPGLRRSVAAVRNKQLVRWAPRF